MLRVHRMLATQQLQSRMLLQVHDELVFETPPDELPAVEALVREAMQDAASLHVPLVVDVGIGDNWLDAKG
jgi:DNA polymerase-1